MSDIPGLQGMVHMKAPADEGVTFWTLCSNAWVGEGTVHVHGQFVDGADYGRMNLPFDPWCQARCGLLRRESTITGIVEFADDRLCGRCWSATPQAEQSGLFQHPTPGGKP